MMKVIYAPSEIDLGSESLVFLAGSIEMGKAKEWQNEFVEIMEGVLTRKQIQKRLLILNPRRKDWDSSWVQEKENVQFHQQVSWELTALELADYIVFFLQAGTVSPVSLLELGLYARSGKILVVCENGFHRKGNVDIVCERYKIPQCETFAVAANMIVENLGKQKNLNNDLR
jgi:hypothetical protein